MSIDEKRRQILLASLAALGAGLPFRSESNDASKACGVLSCPEPELLAVWRCAGSSYAGIASAGKIHTSIKLPQRGHEIVEDPLSRTAVIVARRPGKVLVRVNWNDLANVTYRDAETNRSFNGHGLLSGDGQRFYTTENDLVTGDGIVGIRRSTSLEKIDELPSYGIGPHGALLEHSGTLLVANGGILDVPGQYEATERSEMVSSLVRITSEGRLIQQWSLPDRHLSIRHLAQAPDGNVGIALQAAHPNPEDRVTAPIFAILSRNDLRIVASPPEFVTRGYAGDVVAANIDGTSYFALGCAHAAAIAWWTSDGKWVGFTALERACALVNSGNYLIAATDSGLTARIGPDRKSEVVAEDRSIEWENHLTLRKGG
jgi:uncharacterized protein